MESNQYGQMSAAILSDSTIAAQVITPAVTENESPRALYARLQLQNAVKRGANWFYTIAALSMINSFAAMAGTNWWFVIGLGITQIVDAVASGLGGAGTVAALTVNIFIAGFFAAMAFFAGKFQKWAFVVGMVLFGLDTFISIFAKDVISAGFHLYALYWIFQGYRKIEALQNPAQA